MTVCHLHTSPQSIFGTTGERRPVNSGSSPVPWRRSFPGPVNYWSKCPLEAQLPICTLRSGRTTRTLLAFESTIGI